MIMSYLRQSLTKTTVKTLKIHKIWVEFWLRTAKFKIPKSFETLNSAVNISKTDFLVLIFWMFYFLILKFLKISPKKAKLWFLKYVIFLTESHLIQN